MSNGHDSERSKVIGGVTRALAAVARTAAGLRESARGMAPDRSPADVEVKTWKGLGYDGDEVSAAYHSGQKSLVAAEDLVYGLAAVLADDKAHPFSVAVLVRSLVETASRAFWLLEPGIGPEERATRYMNSQYVANQAALGYGTKKGIGGEAKTAGEDLRSKIDAFFEVPGRAGRRKSVRETALILHAVEAAAKIADSDPTHWRWLAERNIWYLAKVAHGDPVALDSSAKFDLEENRGAASLYYPTRAFEELLGFASNIYVAAVRAAIETLGWDGDFFESIVGAQLAPALAEVAAIVNAERDGDPTVD